MKIVIAPDSFKDSITSKEAAKTILKAFKKVNNKHKYTLLPISDGGEGLLSVLDANLKSVLVKGPLGKTVKAHIGFAKDIAIIEMASSSGLELVPINLRNPYFTTTYGVGELIKEALKYNPKSIVVGLGGSATNDLGLGALNSLGIKFLDKDKKEVGVFGKDLFLVEDIDITNMNKRLNNINLILITDVDNKLLNKDGATYVYGLQKGLKEEDLKKFDDQFKKISNLFIKKFNRDLTNKNGSGAAGGLAYGLGTAFNAEIILGFDYLYEFLKIEEDLKDADVLITGEGKIDFQTLHGKAPFKIAEKGKSINPNLKIYAFTGTNLLKDRNIFNEIIKINDDSLTLDENLKETKKHLYDKALKLAEEIL